MRTSLCVFGVVCASALWAGVRETLWPADKMPDAQPHQIGAMTDEVKAPGFKPEEHRMPYLEWFDAPAQPNGACLILISGGSYKNCCDVGLIKMWRAKFTAEGYQCVNFVYRTPRPEGLPIYQSAWQDGQRAVRMVRSEAKSRGYDPERIGTVSMSAGSHLATLLATSSQTPAYAPVDDLDKTPCHINWAVPMCVAYALTDGLADKNAHGGNGADIAINPAFKFDAKTCPMCLFHGGKDPYSPIGSTRIYHRLRTMKVPAELHLDADRGHGPVNAEMFERALEFMRQMGYLGKLENPQHDVRRWTADGTLKTEEKPLWVKGKMPDPQPNQKYEPTLTWFVPKKLTTKAIQVIFAGGGYGFCNVDGEAVPVAHYLNQKGMTAVSVKYRCPRPVGGKPKHLTAWQDAQRAIRLVRSEAASRGLDPDRIGVMGFSAGGHLTLMAATSAETPAYAPTDEIDKLSCKVQWACPTYPAYVLADGADSPNKAGGNAPTAEFVPDFAFDAATPPMCFVHGDADVYSSMGSVRVWEKLREMGRQSDLHTLALRGHCFQMHASPATGSFTWLDRLWDFYQRKGFLKSGN